MYLLDTNICIHCMRKPSSVLIEKLFSFDPKDLFISSVTVSELEYGSAKSRYPETTRYQVAQFLAPFNILPFTSEDAVCAGRMRQYLESKGTPIGPYDLQIAAQALTRGFAVVTHNTREFKRVPQLVIEDWIKQT